MVANNVGPECDRGLYARYKALVRAVEGERACWGAGGGGGQATGKDVDAPPVVGFGG